MTFYDEKYPLLIKPLLAFVFKVKLYVSFQRKIACVCGPRYFDRPFPLALGSAFVTALINGLNACLCRTIYTMRQKGKSIATQSQTLSVNVALDRNVSLIYMKLIC